MEGLIGYKVKQFTIPTWDELAIYCSTLQSHTICFFTTTGKISDWGSDSGNVGVMCNRGIWKSVTILSSKVARIDFTVIGDQVTYKTAIQEWQYKEL